MPYLRPLQKIRQRFEELAGELDGCQSPTRRRELLRRMKAVIDEADTLIAGEVLQSDSPQNRTGSA
jgi:hypothetical protein